MPCSYFYGDSLITPYTITAFLHAEFLYLRHYWISSVLKLAAAPLGYTDYERTKFRLMIGYELKRKKITTARRNKLSLPFYWAGALKFLF